MAKRKTNREYLRLQVREKNPNWRGGRVITEHGYVLVRVGVNHHLADVRGYAYEHRVVAERKLGRKLRKDEVIHHIDENKLNNHPSNLLVTRGNAGHFFYHRRSGKKRRNPGERNPLILCRCGCGTKFRKFDAGGRPRAFISGHNPQGSPLRDSVLSALRCGLSTSASIAAKTGMPRRNVTYLLGHLKRLNLAANNGHNWAVISHSVAKGG